MPPIEYPNLGLKAGFIIGEEGWGDEMTASIKLLSIVAQGRALEKVAALPGAPVDGDVVILDETNVANPNRIAAYIGAAWEYFVPEEGWLFYNIAANYYEKFDGTVWAELATGGAAALADLTDVDFTTTPPVDGDALVYNDVTNKWEPGEVAGGGGGGGYTRQRAAASFIWNGSAVVILQSLNIASIVRTAAGRYTATFITPFPDANYGAQGIGTVPSGADDGNYYVFGPNRQGVQDTDSYDFVIRNGNTFGVASDPSVYFSIEFEQLVSTGLVSEGVAQYSIAASASMTFPSGVISVDRSNNIASITLVSAGVYDVLFTTPMVDDNYDVSISGVADLTTNLRSQRPHLVNGAGLKTANGFRFRNAFHAVGGSTEVYQGPAAAEGRVAFTVFKDATTTANIGIVTGAAYSVLGTESYVIFDRATAQVVTLNAATPIGFQISGSQKGAGAVSFVAGAGATIISPDASLALRVQYSSFTATKISATEWSLAGDLA